MSPEQEYVEFDEAAEKVIELGNQLLDDDDDADSWDVADGLLAGAVQFWLYSRQPCGDRDCESCADFATAQLRLRRLLEDVSNFAESSDYFHSPNDANVGNA